ncbi:hypothetical protein ACFO4N_05765 [Camelliibacillus cellulosilyticus]|uniref:Uncharacterized protein n=1 Tax=Camelliibacillus cellulosilyticus TaxID=2174486 RepID=A0ABV9GL26_9BACL
MKKGFVKGSLLGVVCALTFGAFAFFATAHSHFGSVAEKDYGISPHMKQTN